MKKINDLILTFLPPAAHSTVEAFRLNKFFVFSCFVTALFAFAYFCMSIYINGLYFAAAMAVSCFLFITLPFLLKQGVPLSILSNIFIADIAVVVVLLIYWEGGIRHANTAPWPLVVPIFAMLMRGWRNAIIWLLITLAIILAFSFFTFQGIIFPVRFDVSKDPLFNLLSLVGLVGIVTTIFYISETEKRQAQEELRMQNVLLENLNKEKDNFLRIVSHDLKSPALIVTEFSKHLKGPDLNEQEKVEYIAHIASSGDRMLDLIKNLLDIQVLESGRMQINKKIFSVNALVEDYIDRIGPLAFAKHIHIRPVLPGKIIELETDKARLEQVLDNYVSNAIKYSPDNTNVFIQLFETDTYLELSVKDEGPGIDQTDMRKLFLQFSIASSVPRQGESSSGLGLALVKKIADSVGALVGCTSEKGKGSLFYIRFPKAASNNI